MNYYHSFYNYLILILSIPWSIVVFCQKQQFYKGGNFYKKPFWKGMKIAEWAENQRFGGKGAQLQYPKWTREEEPELEFFGFVDPITFSPIYEQPNENSLDNFCRDFRFDIRKKWPECAKIIGHIQDQAHCSSCYALSTAAAFSDRFCIGMAKMGVELPNRENGILSAADAMECAGAGTENACAGGYSSKVWKWLTEVGVVRNSCKPYPIQSNKNNPLLNGAKCNEFIYPTICAKKCSNKTHGNEYEGDKIMALNYNVLGTLEGRIKAWNYYKGGQQQKWYSWEQKMKEELAANGSITVDFVVYEDFFSHQKGIYSHSFGSEQYAHVVRLIGYGKVECSADGNGRKYWLAANTWGEDWGEGGMFRIARGNDECGMESRQIGFGLPKL